LTENRQTPSGDIRPRAPKITPLLVVHLVVTDRPGFAGKMTMLTYIQINAAKPRDKEYALSDSQGLYLTVRPNGSKLWRFKYRFLDKQKTLHLGGGQP
jgi:hypothetical protein